MEGKQQLQRQRWVLVRQVERLLEGPMIFLGFVWLALLIAELIWGLSPLLETLSLVIWALFIVDFGLKFFLAPQKGMFIRRNWLTAISLLIPALRVVRLVRLLRVVRVARGLRLVKIVASLNRGMKSLGSTMRRRGFKYVILLTVVVIFGGAAGMYAFEREGGLPTYSEALYWTAMLITSIGSEYWPRTTEGKALTFLLSVYGFCVFGYITATLASFFVGRDAEEQNAPVAGTSDIKALQAQLEAIKEELKLMRQERKG